jgi:hypothetical protein
VNLLYVGLILAAPAPVYKEIPPGFYSGEYRMHWGSYVDVAKFHKDGRYEYIFAKRPYEGRYVWHEKDKVLELWEREVNGSDSDFKHFIFHMDKEFKVCKTEGGITLRFELLKRYK